MALTKISTAMISQSAAAVDLNVDAGTFYVDTTNNRVGVGGKTDPDTPLHVIGTATATTFAGSGASLTSIPNSALVNSSITINSTATSLGGSITLGTDDVAEGSSNLYYTNARADARIAAADTDDLSEGSSNLYYTDARVDARVSGGSLGNITTTGYIRGPATFTIDPAAHGDNTGTVVIAGNLQVDGTTTTINSTTLTVDDKNITLASGSANAAAASGAGFTVDIGTGTNPAITYDGTNDEWDFNKKLNVTGAITSSGDVSAIETGHAKVVSNSVGDYFPSFEIKRTSGSSKTNKHWMFQIGSTGHLHVKDITNNTNALVLRENGDVYIGADSSALNPIINVDVSASSATFAGNIAVGGTVDGVDIAARDAVLTSTTTTAGAALPKAGGTMTGDLTLSGGHDIHLLKTHANDAVDMVFGQLTFGDTTSGQYVNHARIESGGGYAADTDLRFHTSSNNSSPERMRITNTGNVGIGTDAPGRKLHVSGSGATVSVKVEATDGVQSSLDLKNSEGEFRLINDGGALSIYDQTDTTERFRIDTSGKVGIGTDTPSETLELTRLGKIGFGMNGNYGARIGYFDDGSGVHGFHVDTKHIGTTVSESRFVVRADSGKVGIGTKSPTRNLTVKAGSGQEGIELIDADESLFLIQKSGSSTNTSYVSMLSEGSTTVRLHADNVSYFNGGNVGIATSSPTDKLDVAGALRLTANISFDANKAGRIYKASNHGLAFHGVAGTENDFAMFTPAGQLMVINPTGTNNVLLVPTAPNANVGIGTETPTAKLQISHNGGHTSGNVALAHSTLDLYNPLAANTDEKGSVLTFSDNYFGGGSIYPRTTRAAIKGGTDTVGNTADGFLAFYTDSAAANSMPERMRITKDGNVGIGETTPLGKLHVKIADSGASVNASGNGLVIENSGSTGLSILSGTTGDGNIFLGDSGNNVAGTLQYSHNGDSFRISSTGQLLLQTGGGNTRLTLASTGTGDATFTGQINASRGAYVNSVRGLSTTSFTQGTSGTRKLGTFFCGQSGQTILITYIGGQGYNAANYQNGRLYIHFRTSNNSSSQTSSDTGASAFYGSGHWWHEGRGTMASAVQVKQVSATQYEFYITGATFAGNGSVTAKCDHDSRWESTMQDATLSGTYLTLPEEKIFKTGVSVTGNVGIGTTTPTAKITLADHTTAAGGIKFRTASSSVSLWSSGSGNLNTDKSFNLGSRLRLPGGNAVTDPDIGFTGAASGTGFSRATNDITFITAATERMRIDSSGNVIVGTTTTNNGTGKLTVRQTPGAPATTGTATTNVGLRVTTNTSNSQALDFGVYNVSPYGSWIQAVNSGDHSSTYPIILNPNGGNVGIGTASPYSGTNVTSLTVSAASYPVLAMQINGSNAGVLIANSAGLDIYSIGNKTLNLKTNDEDRLTILGTGNVGIGTDSPAAKLEVAGGSTGLIISNLGDASAYDRVELQYSGYNSGTPVFKFRPTQTPGSGTVNSYFRFMNSNGTSTSANNYANVTIDGNVGIGTDSPSYPLHIQTNDGTTNSTVGNILITNLSTGTTVPGFGGHIQFQAERNNGVNQNIGKIAFQSEVNAGTNISAGLRLYTSSAGTMTEKGRISWDGMWFVNGVRNYYQKITIVNNVSYTFDVPIEATGSGHTVYYECMYNHFGNDTYGARRMGFFSFRSLNNPTSADHVVHNGGNSTNAGAWSVSMVGSGTSTPVMRFTKSAGSYSGQGQGYIHVRGGLPI
jgi:hypothetical protein